MNGVAPGEEGGEEQGWRQVVDTEARLAAVLRALQLSLMFETYCKSRERARGSGSTGADDAR